MTYQFDKYKGRWDELDEFYQSDYKFNENNKMNSGIFKLNLKDVAGAVTSAVLVAVLMYVANLTDVYLIDVHHLVNVAVLTGATSLLKTLLTTDTGAFVGAYYIK